LADALAGFRAEGAKGWAFTQTTTSGNKSLVERYDPSKPEFSRWVLLKKDGAAPSAADLTEYEQKLSRRSRGDTAPNVKDQLDRATCERVEENTERATYRFRLKAIDKDDKSAPFMAVTFTLHKPTHTIEQVDLFNVEPFSPVFLVKVAEAKTTMKYSLPEGDRSTLLQNVTVKVRGRAMWIRSLDEDMTVVYSDYVHVGKK
jgi:hypothetical protein